MEEKNLETVFSRIDRLLARREQVTVAIDGSCAAGKTTLAGQIAERYDCNVFHMDDFFLRTEQRTKERYAQVGGNVDYERFREEVLLPLKAGRWICYRPFDCKTFTLSEGIMTAPGKLNIVEGSYSLHPYFGELYDLKIFLTVDPETRRARILQRPEFLHRRFFEEWIPMETRYFEEFGIRERCNLVF